MKHILEQLEEEFPLFTGRSDRGTISKIRVQETSSGAAQIRFIIQVEDGSLEQKAYTITSKKSLSFFTQELKRFNIQLKSWSNFLEDTKPLIGAQVKLKHTDKGLFIHPVAEEQNEH